MTDRLVISNFKTGLETDRTAFIINNDAFPTLENAYIWRGRMLRKRGTTLLGRLEIDLTSQTLGNTSGTGSFTGNIISILGINSIAAGAAIIPGTISITVGGQTFTENMPINGTLTNGTGGTGTIVYATGVLTLQTDPVLMATPVVISFGYYPNLPVMGLEDFEIGTINQPLMISFDTRFSYGFNQGTNDFYNVNFYKTTGTPFNWMGQNYQQFWSNNYQGITTIDSTSQSGCMWVTNSNPGFLFEAISSITVGNPTIITTASPHGLVTGDWVWFNENTGADGNILNGLSFQITKTGANTFTIPLNSTGKALTNTGIFETLTATPPGNTGDGIKWYDGDPTASNNFGWVNFAPPLSPYSSSNPNPQYLVGAKTIIVFKNRLLFFGVYLSTSQVSPGIQYYPNRMVYSQVGTPFYTNPLPFNLSNQSPDMTAWYQTVAGKGGFLTAPIDQEVITTFPNKDYIICGYESKQLRLISTGDDSLPFIYQIINSEYGSQNTFSGVVLDEGVLSIGDVGIAMTTSTSCQRIDLQIPDQVFEIATDNEKDKRVTAIRDFQKEFVYFTFCPTGNSGKVFNSQTLLYNYRDNTWALFDENYTHYGTFRRTTYRTWANIGQTYPTWNDWTDPWNFGGNAAFFPTIVGGNQQGFVLEKGSGVEEGNAEYISAISGITITSPNHGLSTGDFIQLSGIIGTTNLNGLYQQITVADPNSFTINVAGVGAYIGGGVFRRISLPFIQTKQFPIFWNDSRGVRVGTQRFLLETTDTGQITVNVYASQNPDDAVNDPTSNQSIIFSNVVLTSPEPNNPASISQDQIWHRVSNSFNGDTIQIGFTLSDSQMLNPNINEQEIIIHAIALDLYPGPALAI